MAAGDAPRHFVAAQRLAEQGRWTEARAAYRAALAADPAFLPAAFALGQLLRAQGDDAAAHAVLSHALTLAASDPAARRAVAPALADLLAGHVPATYAAATEADLLACLEVADVDPQPLAWTLARLLLLKYPDPAADMIEMGRDPLWLALLTRCLNVDQAMEQRLSAARGALVATGLASQAEMRTACALSLQAFAGEYAWPGEEPADLGALPPLLRTLYRPLIDADVAAPRKLKKDRLSGQLVKQTHDEPLQERALAAAMPSLAGASVDPVSRAVRAQYEEHPYPRWRSPPAPRPMPLRDTLAALPGIDGGRLPPAPLRVLIAGAGTGYEAIGLARIDPSLAITALDLSRASLAYGQRMAEELEVGGIDFIAGDLLDAAALGAPFDVVYATGVLHHMDDPATGLASLVAILRPGGAMRIGLYSRAARGPIRAARALIAECGWPPTPEGIRAFRAHIVALPETDPLAEIARSPDFYSLSGCRDLVFHVQEHQHDLPGITAMLAGAGLTVAGIDATPDVAQQFARAHGPAADPLDLARWEALEAADPSLFAGMYLVWCQKRS